MTTHTNLTTKSLIDGTHGLTFQADDVIITNGYYNADDGAGAKFNVVSGTTTDGSYFEYTLTETLKAVMVIENGTVNIDQLGAKGDAVLPEAADGFDNAYINQIISSNENSFDNCFILTAALNNPEIINVVLGENKNYGVRSCVSAVGNSNNLTKNIIGNGSKIIEISSEVLSLIQVLYFEKFSIKNVELIKGTGQNGSAAIFLQNNDKALIKDISVKSLVHGIYSESLSKKHSLMVYTCSILAKSVGILSNGTNDSTISDCYITGLDRNSSIGFQIFPCGENIKFNNVNISNAVTAYYFYGSSSSNIVKDCTLYDVTAQNCGSVFNFSNTQNITASSVTCREISSVASFNNAENICICNSDFINSNNTNGLVFNHVNKVCNNVLFANCSFDFNKTLFKSRHTTSSQNKAHMSFSDCSFNLKNSDSDPDISPAEIFGGTLDVDFSRCKFNVEKYATPTNGNEYLFYFKTQSSSCLPHYWNFSDCKFTQGTGVPVKSVILIDSQKDAYEKTFVTVQNSTLNGFEQIMHLTDAVYDEVNTVESLLDAKKRYLAIDNLYFFDTIPTGATTHYKKAEEYGLSE